MIEGIREAVAKSESNGKTQMGIICENSRKMLPKIIDVLVGEDSELEYINPQDVTLEDVFIAKTGRPLSVDTREVIIEKKGG